MLVDYGGIGLKVTRMAQCGRFPKYTYDGLSYLYTHWRVHAQAIVSKAAIPAGSFIGSSQQKSTAYIQDVVRSTLRTPRLDLTIISEDGTTLLLCGQGQDALGGPYPHLFDIRKVVGIKTFEVDFVIDAFVVEDGKSIFGQSGPFMLSNRWRCSEIIDVDHLPARRTTGIAYFHVGRLYSQRDGQEIPMTADQFRSSMFLPIPPGWRRTAIRTELASNNGEVRYSFTDRLNPILWGNRGITRVQATHHSHCSQASPSEVQLQFTFGELTPLAGQATGGVQGVKAKLGIGNKPGPMGGSYMGTSLGIAGYLAGVAARAFNAWRHALPQFWENVNVSVWGDQDTTRANLILTAFGIAEGVLGKYRAGLGFLPAERFVLHRNMMRRYVSLSFDIRPGPVNTSLQGRIALDPNLNTDENVSGSPNGTLYLVDPNPASPGAFNPQTPEFPPADMVRATPRNRAQLLSLVAQALEKPGVKPDPPQNIYVSQKPDQQEQQEAQADPPAPPPPQELLPDPEDDGGAERQAIMEESTHRVQHPNF